MFGIIHFGFFMAAVFLLNITPGPDTAYIVGRSVAQGRGAGIVSALGISAGCCVHVCACALGLTALLAASAMAFTVVKTVGAIYLIYLGLRLILARHQGEDAPAPVAESGAQRPLRKLFAQGFLTNVLNPKVVLFFVAFFPQFVTPDSPHKALAFLALGAVFVAMSTVWNTLVAWMAGTVTARFSGKPGVRRWLDRGVGGAFVGLGLKLAVTHR